MQRILQDLRSHLSFVEASFSYLLSSQVLVYLGSQQPKACMSSGYLLQEQL